MVRQQHPPPRRGGDGGGVRQYVRRTPSASQNVRLLIWDYVKYRPTPTAVFYIIAHIDSRIVVDDGITSACARRRQPKDGIRPVPLRGGWGATRALQGKTDDNPPRPPTGAAGGATQHKPQTPQSRRPRRTGPPRPTRTTAEGEGPSRGGAERRAYPVTPLPRQSYLHTVAHRY